MSTVSGYMTTSRPGRYAKQLTSHWSSYGPVTEEDGGLVQQLEDGHTLTLTPAADRLRITVAAGDDRDVQPFADVVAAHLERFGDRENLSVVWEVTPS